MTLIDLSNACIFTVRYHHRYLLFFFYLVYEFQYGTNSSVFTKSSVFVNLIGVYKWDPHPTLISQHGQQTFTYILKICCFYCYWLLFVFLYFSSRKTKTVNYKIDITFSLNKKRLFELLFEITFPFTLF